MRYNLKPTPANHVVKLRPFYHELRAALDAIENPVLADLIKIENDIFERKNAGTPAPAQPPPSVPFSMVPFLRPTLDQGTEGDCGAFAGCAAQALCEGIQAKTQNAFDYSQQDLYWNTRSIAGTTGSDSGVVIGDVVLAQENVGTCEESFFPYVAGQFTTPPPPDAVANEAQHKAKFKAYPLDTTDPGNIIQALGDGCPVIFGFEVPPSFENCPADGILPDPTGESSLGGHANLLFYDPECPVNYLSDQNSWGAGWGLNGRCRMPLEAYVSRFIEAYVLVPTA
jgi:papain like protease